MVQMIMINLCITIELVYTTTVLVSSVKFAVIEVSNTTHNSNAHTAVMVTGYTKFKVFTKLCFKCFTDCFNVFCINVCHFISPQNQLTLYNNTILRCVNLFYATLLTFQL